MCDKRFIWNPSNCNCECDKSCEIGEYLDYKNCKCRRKIVGELVEEYSENIDENEMIYETLLVKECNKNISKILSTSSNNSCRPYVVLFIVFLIIGIIISSVFVYFYLYSRSKKVFQAYYY